MVVEQHDWNVGGLEVVLELTQSLEGTPAAVPEQKPFFFGQFSSRMGARFVRHLFKPVDQTEIDVGRQDVFANALGDVRVNFVFVEFARFVVLLEHRTVRVDAPNLNVGVLLLQVLGGATDGAPRANADHEVGDFAFRLLPNLRSGRTVMGFPVGEVVVLVAPHAVGDLVVQTLSHAVVAVRMVWSDCRGTHMDFRPHGAQHVHLFLALLAVGGADEAVPFHDAGKREAHARVA